MKFVYIVIIIMLGINTLHAEIPDHHLHVGNTQLKFFYDFLDFKNSKQKTTGRRKAISIDYQDHKHHYQLYVEHTDTQTKPILDKDLSVNKYSLKYQYSMSKTEILSFMHIRIDDNLVKAVDAAKIYGVGYKYKVFSCIQYISDYTNFNVYQTDVKWRMKKEFFKIHVKTALMGKYIYIQDRMSNSFTNKTKQDYFTLGVKIHAKYNDWHIATVGYIGERIFSVMNEGLRVQHHAMAFQKSAMFSLGKKFDTIFINLRYIKQYATEIPIDNKNVKVSNIALTVAYTF